MLQLQHHGYRRRIALRRLPGAVTYLGPVLTGEDLDLLDGIWHRYGHHRSVARPAAPEQRRSLSFAPGIGSRADASRNFLRTGGRLARTHEPPALLRARTSYFREEYAYGDDLVAAGIERFLLNQDLANAAEKTYGMPVVVPYVAYGNLLVPGQELGLHTDVPAFRGADRSVLPLWLLVVMRHSRLFERWRVPIATAVAFVGDCSGGAFACYPDGPEGLATELRPQPGSVVVLDADTVFHGVDRVGGDDSGIRSAGTGPVRLRSRPKRTWELLIGRGPDALDRFAYGSDQLRFSVSWKAYCFADEDDLKRWRRHSDDLDISLIKNALVTELTRRGALASPVQNLPDRELALLMIDTFVRFPEVGAAAVS
jgi:hypothetical protein